jgi:oligopeptide transport system ATP-binding protein
MGKERLKPIDGQPPDMINPPAGCPFVERCPNAMEICAIKKTEYKMTGVDHGAACWLLYKDNGGEV